MQIPSVRSGVRSKICTQVLAPQSAGRTCGTSGIAPTPKPSRTITTNFPIANYPFCHSRTGSPSAEYRPASSGLPEDSPLTTATRLRVTKNCVRNAMTAAAETGQFCCSSK